MLQFSDDCVVSTTKGLFMCNDKNTLYDDYLYRFNLDDEFAPLPHFVHDDKYGHCGGSPSMAILEDLDLVGVGCDS